jgi:hypothetical protein
MARIKAMRFILAAPKMIQEGYDKASHCAGASSVPISK